MVRRRWPPEYQPWPCSWRLLLCQLAACPHLHCHSDRQCEEVWSHSVNQTSTRHYKISSQAQNASLSFISYSQNIQYLSVRETDKLYNNNWYIGHAMIPIGLDSSKGDQAHLFIIRKSGILIHHNKLKHTDSPRGAWTYWFTIRILSILFHHEEVTHTESPQEAQTYWFTTRSVDILIHHKNIEPADSP